MTEKEQPVILFKVLEDMKSCHGGRQSWKLGEKYTVEGPLVMCENGFHLTTDPQEWLRRGRQVYFAEAFGIAAWEGDKCVCRSVRLLKKQDPNGVSAEVLVKWQPERDAVYVKWKPERDAVYAKWNSELDAVYVKWNSERDAVYVKWNSELDAVDVKWQPERDAVYAKWNSERDAVDVKWNSELDAVDVKWQPERDAVYAKWQPERDAVYAKWRNEIFTRIAELYRLQNKPRKTKQTLEVT
jgi:hypothetical protein